MHLTLVPPSSYPIPQTLQTHDFPPPSGEAFLKLPKVPTYMREKRALERLGLPVIRQILTLDRTMWLSHIVDEVVWNLETDQVRVEFVDGSCETWEFEEESTKEVGAKGANSQGVNLASENGGNSFINVSGSTSEQLGAETSGNRKETVQSTTMRKRLATLSIELRSAFEDIGQSSVSISSEEEYELIMELSAKPSSPLPDRWTPSPALLVDGGARAVPNVDTWNFTEVKLDALGESLAQFLDADPESPEDQASFSLRGQLHSRLRASSLEPGPISRLQTTTTNSPDKILSFIGAVSNIRRYLVELFASFIIPSLRERLPETYALWAARNAQEFCRREAVKRGALIAKMFLELMDDDGNGFDSSSDEEEQDDIEAEKFSDTSGEEDEESIREGFKWWSTQIKSNKESRRDMRAAKNILFEMKDDLPLRIWSEQALVRAVLVETAETEMMNVGLGVGRTAWLANIQPWEITRPCRGPRILGALAAPRSSTTAWTSSPPTPTPAKGPPNTPKSPTRKTRGSTLFLESTDEETTDDDADVVTRALRAQIPTATYFYPQDLFEECLMPTRLPTTLLRSSNAEGKIMEGMRQKIKLVLDEIAGLQKKMVELSDFSQVRNREVQLRLLTNSDDDLSSTSASPRKPHKATIPLQPLRYQTADLALAATLADKKAELNKNAIRVPIPKDSSNAPGQSAPLVPPPTTSPRKKQAANLVLLASVQGSDTKQKKGGRRPLESSVGGKRSRSVAESDSPADQTAGLELMGVVTARDSINKDDSPSPLKKKKLLKKKGAAAPAVSGTTVVDVPPSPPVKPNGPVMSDSPPRTPSPVHPHSPKTSSPLHTSPTLRKSRSSSRPLLPEAATTSSPIARSISPELVDSSFRRLTPHELSTQRRGPNSSRDETHTFNAWDNFPSMDVDDETGDLLVEAGTQAGISESRNITKGRLVFGETSSRATPPELEQDDRAEDEMESDDVDMPEEEEWEKWADYNAYISHKSDGSSDIGVQGLEGYLTSHSAVNTTAHGLSEVLHLERAPSSFPKSFQFLYPSDTLHIHTQAGDFGLLSSDVTSLPSSSNVSVHSPMPIRPRLTSPFHILSNHDSSSSGSDSSEEDEAEVVERLLGTDGKNAASP